MLQRLHVIVNPLEHSASLVLRLQQTYECLHVVFVVGVKFNLNIYESVFVWLLLNQIEKAFDVVELQSLWFHCLQDGQLID